MKNKPVQKKDYDINLIFKQLLLNPLLDLDKNERRAYRDRVFKPKKGDNKMKKLSLILAVVILFFAAPVFGVILTWDPNSETDLAGYLVYSVEKNSAEEPYIDGPVAVSENPTFTLNELCYDPGKTYEYWVTAFNTTHESGPSNIVEYTWPTANPADKVNPRPIIINIPVEAGPVTINVIPGQ